MTVLDPVKIRSSVGAGPAPDHEHERGMRGAGNWQGCPLIKGFKMFCVRPYSGAGARLQRFIPAGLRLTYCRHAPDAALYLLSSGSFYFLSGITKEFCTRN